MNITNLKPLNQKSFYGKAKMIREGNITRLKSYNTIVAQYDHNSKKMSVKGWYSRTTANHINSFLHNFGFNTCSKSELNSYND